MCDTRVAFFEIKIQIWKKKITKRNCLHNRVRFKHKIKNQRPRFVFLGKQIG